MKVTVFRRQQGDGTIFYVSNLKDSRGNYGQYTQQEVEGNPVKFTVQESGSVALPKALRELNETIALLPKKSAPEQSALAESWQRIGLSPEAAAVAARVESKNRPADLPPATEWAAMWDEARGGK